MSGRARAVLVCAMFLAALAGVGLGRVLPRLLPCRCTNLQELIHRGLHLDATQLARVNGLERQYEVEHRRVRLQLSADDAALAAAYQAERNGGPKTEAATAQFAVDMRRCQQAFMAQVSAVRQVLTAAQAERYDQAVVKALTDTPR